MVTIIILVLLGLVFTDYIFYGEFFFLIASSIIGGIIGGIIGFAIALAIPPVYVVEKTTHNLEALQDNSAVSGSFFLGSGNINGDIIYTYYYENNDSFKLNQVEAKDAKIKYTEGTPKVEVLKYVNKNQFALRKDYFEYIFYVPKNSIKQSYSLDAN